MLSAEHTRNKLEKMFPDKHVTAKKEYIAYSLGDRKEVCSIYISGSPLGTVEEGKTFEECLAKLKSKKGE